jgi:hypothetical protein
MGAAPMQLAAQRLFCANTEVAGRRECIGATREAPMPREITRAGVRLRLWASS